MGRPGGREQGSGDTGRVRHRGMSNDEVREILAAVLPPISHLPQVAAFIGRTPKAVRNAIARGTFPAGRWIAGKRCWAHEDLVNLLVETAQRPSHLKAELVKVQTRPAPHDPEHRVQVDMMFDCNDPRSAKARPLRIQKTAPAGYSAAAAEAWAKEHAERFLAELLGKTMRKETEEARKPQPKAEEQKTRPQAEARKPRPQAEARKARPKAEPPLEATKAVTLTDMFEQMADRVIIHEEPTTQDTWRSIWRCHLQPRFGEMPIELITKTRILEFREELQKRYAPTTCNHIISKVQGILSYAVEMEKLAAAPKIGRLKSQDAAEKDPYSDEEMELVLAAANGDEVGTLALLLSLDAGLRRSEMLALRWCDVDLKDEQIHIRHTLYKHRLKCVKGKKVVAVPMRARLKAELVKAKKDRKPVDFVFPGVRHAWLSVSGFSNYMRDLAARAGVEWRGFHKGKHTFITMLLEGGATLNELQLLARHKHASTTEGYMHVRNATKAMRTAIARLDNAPQEQGPEPVKSALKLVKSS